MEVTIKELGEIITGNTPSKKTEEFWNSEDICFVKPDIISENGINEIFESNEYISEEAKKKARVVSKDSIFITCIGSIGKIGIALDGEYAFNQQINAIIPNDKILPKYLAYNLLYNRSRLISIANAPVVPIINKSQFSDFAINIDSNKNKQLEIVNVLDKLTYIIELRNDELSALDDLIKARFVELFENGDYKTEKLGSVCTKITDGTHKTPTYLDEGITFISAKNIVNGELDFSDVKHISGEEYQEIQKRCQTAIYDILLSKSGSLGAPVIIKTEEKLGLFESLAVIKYDREKLLPEFLCEQLKTDRIQRQFTTGTKGVAIKHLHLGVIAETDVIVPPIEEQRQFADFVKQVDKSKFQKYNATILSHNIYVFETRRRFICKPTLII